VRIAFRIYGAGYTGTDISTLKLAESLSIYSGVSSTVFFVGRDCSSESLALLKSSFPLVHFPQQKALTASHELDSFVASNNINYIYTQLGEPSLPDIYSGHEGSMFVHCVAQVRPLTCFRFTYTSKFLAAEFSDNPDNFLPYIVHLPDHDANFRSTLNIPSDARVFGRLGGDYSWNVRFVDKLIAEYADANPDAWFLLCNVPHIWPYHDHPRIIRVGPIVFNESLKRAFINTCDAMIHARSEGETFGLACAEFAYCNRKVITYSHSPERAHIEMLGEALVEYDSPAALWYKLDTVGRCSPVKSSYKSFNAAFVADRFIDLLS
jgi:hypothetical protein